MILRLLCKNLVKRSDVVANEINYTFLNTHTHSSTYSIYSYINAHQCVSSVLFSIDYVIILFRDVSQRSSLIGKIDVRWVVRCTVYIYICIHFPFSTRVEDNVSITYNTFVIYHSRNHYHCNALTPYAETYDE